MLAFCDLGLWISVEKLEMITLKDKNSLFCRGTNSWNPWLYFKTANCFQYNLFIANIPLVLEGPTPALVLLHTLLPALLFSLPATMQLGETFCRWWKTKMHGWFQITESDMPVKGCSVMSFLPSSNCDACFLELKWNSHRFFSCDICTG